MNIWAMLWQNIRRGVTTLRYPARPPVSSGFRGMVHFDPTRCTGCAMCRFRCTAHAITFTSAGKEFTWSYDAAHCTFCGRCVDGCKDHALSQDQACPAVYLSAGSLQSSYTLQRKPAPKKEAVSAETKAEDNAGGGSS